jgi:hypothetical protein
MNCASSSWCRPRWSDRGADVALVFGLCIILGTLVGILLTAVLIFRLACKWCNLERPGLMAASGIVILSWVAWAIAEAVMIAALQVVYEALGYPLWEARFVGFFLGLPFHLVVTSLLHIMLMRVSLGKAIEVWFLQQGILLSIALALIGMLAIGYLAAGNK